MSGYGACSENALVEQPAIKRFDEMGWQKVLALEETFGVGGWLDYETKGKAIVVPRHNEGGKIRRGVASMTWIRFLEHGLLGQATMPEGFGTGARGGATF